MLPTILLATLSAFTFAIANTLAAKTGENRAVLTNLYYKYLFSVSAFLVLFLISLFFFPITGFDPVALIYVVFIGIFGFCGLLALFQSLSTSPVGLTIVISNTSIIFTVLTSYIVFGTQFSVFQFTGIILALVGIYLIYATKNLTTKSLKGLKYAVVNSIVWGIGFAFYRFGLPAGGPFTLSLLIEIFGFITLIFIFKKKKLDIPKISNIMSKKHVLALFITIGFASAIGVNARVIGQAMGNIPLVESTITALTPVFSLVLARFWFKETLTFQQYGGVLTVLIGILIVIIG